MNYDMSREDGATTNYLENMLKHLYKFTVFNECMKILEKPWDKKTKHKIDKQSLVVETALIVLYMFSEIVDRKVAARQYLKGSLKSAIKQAPALQKMKQKHQVQQNVYETVRNAQNRKKKQDFSEQTRREFAKRRANRGRGFARAEIALNLIHFYEN